MSEFREALQRLVDTTQEIVCDCSMQAHSRYVEAIDAAKALLARGEPAPKGFQHGVDLWMASCFGDEIASDKQERNHRFLEEALELVQSCGCTRSEALQLVDYVFSRPTGERGQEVGGAMVTLAALCNAQQLDMQTCADAELARVWTEIHKIRAKQLAKPKHSPLPESAEPAAADQPYRMKPSEEAAFTKALASKKVEPAAAEKALQFDAERAVQALAEIGLPIPAIPEDALANFRRDLLARRDADDAAEKARELCWLIERRDLRTGVIQYRWMDDMGPQWTSDPNKAMRFCRRVDAEMFAAGDDECTCIVEHMFASPPAATGEGK